MDIISDLKNEISELREEIKQKDIEILSLINLLSEKDNKGEEKN